MIGAVKAWVLQYALVILAGLLALALAAAGVQTIRLKSLEASTAQALAEASEDARAKESAWQSTLTKVRDEKDAEIRSVAAARDAGLARVRNRRPRLPEAARAACEGSTGRELSGGDAEFLVRLAGRADELRAELAACYRREEALSR